LASFSKFQQDGCFLIPIKISMVNFFSANIHLVLQQLLHFKLHSLFFFKKKGQSLCMGPIGLSSLASKGKGTFGQPNRLTIPISNLVDL
jgi:hypothetical protein